MSEHITTETHEDVWNLVQGAGIDVNPTVVAAYDDVVSDLLDKGLQPEDVSGHVVLAIRRQWQGFKAGMEAFEAFCECLTFAVSLDKGTPDPMDTLAHIVTTKAALAAFYDDLATVAPYAGVQGLDRDVTRAERAESVAQRDDILAKIEVARKEAADDDS